jgi:hypothetical protein
MAYRRAALLIALCVVLVVGCGGGGGGGSCTSDFTGDFIGPVNDVFGSGTLKMTFAQDGCGLGGSFAVCTQSAGCSQGVLQGNAVGNTFTVKLFDPSAPNACHSNAEGSLVSANEAVGSFSRESCQAGGGGTFDISRPMVVPI